MAQSLDITPFRSSLHNTLDLPGSKSITNRALIVAALCESGNIPILIKGALFSRDTYIMLEALKRLGFEISENHEESSINIKGLGGSIPNKRASINVGNAGTAARFLTALLSLQEEGVYELDGDSQMRKRPMKGIINALEQLKAARFEYKEKPYHFPFTMHSLGINEARAKVNAQASSQILSALLLVLPASGKPLELECENFRNAYVSLTEAVKIHFQGRQAGDYTSKCISPFYIKGEGYQNPRDNVFEIEPDLSAASYFFALTLLHGGSLMLPRIPKNPTQGDKVFAELLQSHGLKTNKKDTGWLIERSNNLTMPRGKVAYDFNLFSDTFLTYAAIAPLINESTLITGIAHTRLQETDRVKAMAIELRKLGQTVLEEADSLQIISNPKALIEKARIARKKRDFLSIETYEDHRFAMSFGVLGTYDLFKDGSPWLKIKDPGCCSKTFPDFFKTLSILNSGS